MTEQDETGRPAGRRPATIVWALAAVGVLAICILLFSALRSDGTHGPSGVAPSKNMSDAATPAVKPGKGKAEVVQVSDQDTTDAPQKKKPAARVTSKKGAVKGAYSWQVDTIYRFRFEKHVSVSRRHEGEPPSRRDSIQKGILVFEVQRIERDGTAKGTLRLDSPRVDLPPLLFFDTETNRTREDKDRHRKLRVALEECLRSARWQVILDGTGRIRVTQREPEDLRRWLEDAVAAGRWSKRVLSRLGKMLSDHLELWGQLEDDQLFITVGGDVRAKRSTSRFDALRPRRALKGRATQNDERYALTFTHVPAESAPMDTEIQVPLLNKKERPVRITVKSVDGKGKATFDEKMGMIDALEEDYEVSMSCACGNRKLTQEVKVKNKLLRIAPPLRKNGEGTEDETKLSP